MTEHFAPKMKEQEYPVGWYLGYYGDLQGNHGGYIFYPGEHISDQVEKPTLSDWDWLFPTLAYWDGKEVTETSSARDSVIK